MKKALIGVGVGCGFLVGIAGPYPSEKEMLEHPLGILSEFEKFDSSTPEEHVNKIFKSN